jgi:hypothetical protein
MAPLELCLLVHGGQRERAGVGARAGSARESEGELSSSIPCARKGRARGSNGDRALRMTATSRTRGGHCGISTNTWQTAVWVRWNTDLGRLQAGLGHGPKSKIEAHITLYKTCLRVMVISVVDEEIISPQITSVNTLH